MRGYLTLLLSNTVAMLFIASNALAQPLQDKLVASDGDPSDAFGASVSISGDVAVFGAFADEDAGEYSGSAYVYRYDPATNTWTEEQKLVPSDARPWQYFGISVAVSDDVALIGASLDDENGFRAGAAYVFRFDTATRTWIEEQKLLAPSGQSTSGFGIAVALSGTVAVVGSPYEDAGADSAGAAYVYHFDEVVGEWKEEQRLSPSDPGRYSVFGASVAICDDTIAIGRPGDDTQARDAGAAYIFRYEPATFRWVEEQKLVAFDGAEGDGLFKVSISGDVLVAGAPRNSEYGHYSGAAYAFRFDPEAGSWIEEQKFVAADATEDDFYGVSLAVDGDRLIIGAPYDDDDGLDSGSAWEYRFEAATGEWEAVQKLLPFDGEPGEGFGGEIALSGDAAVISAVRDGANVGAVYVFRFALPVRIDISPGSSHNVINPFSRGLVPVAILGSPAFDVSDVNFATVGFGPNAVPPAFGSNGPRHPRSGRRDVDHDGFADAIVFFRIDGTGIALGDSEACLTGETIDAVPFEGCDGIATVPGCGHGFEATFLVPPLVWGGRRVRRRRK